MRPRLLCVDDDVNILKALERLLYDRYDIVCAASPEDALRRMEASIVTAHSAARGSHGVSTFDVVISDMRMPGMSGADLLARIHDMYPDPIRILLTGQADMKDAIAAVNRGRVFRFLMKPCPPAELVTAIDAALEQQRLRNAEREILDGTVTGTVKLIGDLLALANPALFARNMALVRIVEHVGARIDPANSWHYTVAATLAPIGMLALEDDLVVRMLEGRAVQPHDARHIAELPEIAFRLLSQIPRLETVAQIIREHKAACGGSPVVTRGAQLLNLAAAFERLLADGRPRESVISELAASKQFPPDMLVALTDLLVGSSGGAARSASVAELRVGMFLEKDILTKTGAVLVKGGQVLSQITLERVQRFQSGGLVLEPIAVRLRA